MRSRMQVAASLCAAALLVVLPGCLELDAEETFKADGSGTSTMKIVFDEGMNDKLKQSMPEGMGTDEQDHKGDHQVDVERIAAVAGVKLVSQAYAFDEATKKHTTELELSFESMEAFYKSGIPQGLDVSLEKTEDGAWLLTRVMKQESGEDGGMEGEMDPNDPQMAMVKGMLAPFMSNLRFTWAITVPGAIVETNGTRAESGSRVSWTLKFDDMFDSKKQKMTVKFKADDLKIKPFKVSAADMNAARDKLDEDLAAKKGASDVDEPDDDDGEEDEPEDDEDDDE